MDDPLFDSDILGKVNISGDFKEMCREWGDYCPIVYSILQSEKLSQILAFFVKFC